MPRRAQQTEPGTGIAALPPVTQQSTAAIVAGRLRSAIRDATLPPGSQLAEVELARQLGVSRGPLREAMQRLVAEGLLVSERNRGLFVRELTAADIADIYTSRIAVERAAMQLLLDHDREAIAAELETFVDDMRLAARGGDSAAMCEADRAFHERMVAGSGSPRLQRMAATLLVEAHMCINVLQETYTVPSELAEEHQIIVEAIRDGDRRAAIRVVVDHLSSAVARLAPSSVGWLPDAPDTDPAVSRR